MENKYVALKIYNNFNWQTILRKLEKNNYRWNSGDKPTRLYFDTAEGTIYINPTTKTIARTDIDSFSIYCKCYITVK